MTVEEANDGRDEVHFHAGGQGFWIARLLGRLGVPTTLCTPFGGESGRVARALVDVEPVAVRAVETAEESGAWVHDRRSGDREPVAEVSAAPLRRHDADELYGAALAAGIDAGVCVLTGPHSSEAVPPDHYRRLATDLRRNGTTVIADLSGPELAAALEGGVDLCKVSHDDLAETDHVDVPADALEAVRALRRMGADRVVITRAARPLLAGLGDEVLEAKTPELEVADHRGAGDAFTAMVAATQHWGLDWHDAVRWGAAAGALTVVRRGLATADRREIERFLERIDLRSAA